MALLTNLGLPTTSKFILKKERSHDSARVAAPSPPSFPPYMRKAVAADVTGHESIYFQSDGMLLRQQGARIFKAPFYAEENLKRVWLGDSCVCHVIVPLRAAELTAESRAAREGIANGEGGFVPGVKSMAEELWHDRALVADLITDLAQHDIPFTTLAFPRHTTDGEYAWDKLQWLLSRHLVEKTTFLAAHQVLFDPAVAADDQSVPDAPKQCLSKRHRLEPATLCAFLPHHKTAPRRSCV